MLEGRAIHPAAADTGADAGPQRRELLSRLRGLGSLAVLTPMLGLGGCAAFDYRAADAPRALAQPPRLDPPPRLAIVLGSGGPRGYAHIGVLRVLEDARILPDLVVGSSVGAVLGAFWASGLSAAQIDALSMQGGPLTIFDPSPFADRGWIHGRKLQDYVNQGLGGRALEELPRRVIVIATRRDDKAPRFFASGNAGVAVRASSAMPGIFSPVGIEGIEYEDGDESLPLGVTAARAAGARFVSAPSMGAILGVKVPRQADHSEASEVQLRKGDRTWEGSMERKP